MSTVSAEIHFTSVSSVSDKFLIRSEISTGDSERRSIVVAKQAGAAFSAIIIMSVSDLEEFVSLVNEFYAEYKRATK